MSKRVLFIILTGVFCFLTPAPAKAEVIVLTPGKAPCVLILGGPLNLACWGRRLGVLSGMDPERRLTTIKPRARIKRFKARLKGLNFKLRFGELGSQAKHSMLIKRRKVRAGLRQLRVATVKCRRFGARLDVLQCGGNPASPQSSSSGSSSSACPGPEAIAVWAYPDSVSLPYRDGNNRIIEGGTAHIGVAAYHVSGINRVEFSIPELSFRETVAEENINPETNEGEYFFALSPSDLPFDGTYHITAVAHPNCGPAHVLPNLTIFKDTALHTVWYADAQNGSDTSGDGSADRPFKTIGRALGTDWGAQEPKAESGDLLKVRAGTYPLPAGQYASFTKYVTVLAESPGSVNVQGGVLRSPFIKFIGINFLPGGVAAYSHHYWFKDCSYTGYGKIWADTIDRDEAFRSRYVSLPPPAGPFEHPGNVIVENFTVHDANQGLSLIGEGNYILRNSHVFDQNGDGLKHMGKNVLITGNRVHDIAGPKAWSVAKALPPYDFGAGLELAFYISTDYGKTFPATPNVTVLLQGQMTASQLAEALNLNSAFAGEFKAAPAEAPYPLPGHLRIETLLRREQNRFYADGAANTVLRLSDNTRALNDISAESPAMNSTDHNDIIANDDRDLANVVIRNNWFYATGSQGLKFDGIGRGEGQQLDFLKENIAIVNNVIAGGCDSARLLYFNYLGSGTPRARVSYHNLFLAHNTIFKPENCYVRAAMTIDMSNPGIRDFVFINNILGEYHTGDWVFGSLAAGLSDFNLFFPTQYIGGTLSPHSTQAEPRFLDSGNGDYQLSADSPARDRGAAACTIKYDLKWKERLALPDLGAFEYQ